MEQAFERLADMLGTAATRVGPNYFQLPVAAADAMYRERVYCYELYHQIRELWGDFPFSLGGEIDKSGHPSFVDGPYARAKPDLLIHTPGSMDENLAVVEVKPATTRQKGIRDDIRKLRWFHQNANYFVGVFLVYGEAGDPEIVAQRVRDSAAAQDDLESLVCLYHRHVGERPERLQL